ncbi:acyl-CoA-binding domain-containing protein 4 isoform X2 [Ambystoma mexicanum]|uniref:acyl-CoA-binding domain-containing protein 4 isoform X2 n=1 Tax=Ambystoma mexicanum TaxID=8296 RepID=UPI0037E8304B
MSDMLRVQDATEHKKQFQAAVDVIQRLPKNGPYRPSYEVMLRFYSYYKQATMGHCNIPRPGFWDPIGRYKWDAWNGLGALTPDEAMAAYIREMKRVAQTVIDTVPLEESSSEMFHYFEPLYNVIPDMPRPPEYLFKKLRGEEQRHLKEQCCTSKPKDCNYLSKQLVDEQQEPEMQLTFPQNRGLELEEKLENNTNTEISKQHNPSLQLSEKLVTEILQPSDTVDNSQVTSDSETEVFCDSLDQLELDQNSALLDCENGYQVNLESLQLSWGSESEDSSAKQSSGVEGYGERTGRPIEQSIPLQGLRTAIELQQGRDIVREKLHTETNVHVTAAVRRLQEDMQIIQIRLTRLEGLVSAKKHWWQMPEALGPTLLFLVLWPFVVQWMLHKYRHRKR